MFSNIIKINLCVSQNSRDTATSTYITSILREALCLKQGKGKKCSGRIIINNFKILLSF